MLIQRVLCLLSIEQQKELDQTFEHLPTNGGLPSLSTCKRFRLSGVAGSKLILRSCAGEPLFLGGLL